MIILRIEQILQIHALVVHETGGSLGLRDLERLESAVASQTQAVFGEDLYSSLYQKAAAVIRGIIGDHPFVDGNKRTAMLTGITFLDINGLEFIGPAGSIENFAVQIAVEHISIAEIAKWLEQHTRAIK